MLWFLTQYYVPEYGTAIVNKIWRKTKIQLLVQTRQIYPKLHSTNFILPHESRSTLTHQWRPPDEEEVDTAERETTEDNILSIEEADDCLGKGEKDKGDAKVEVHSRDCAHKVYNKGCPVFQVMEHAKSVTWRADTTAVISTLPLGPFGVSR